MATLPTSDELRQRLGLTADEFNAELGDAAIAAAIEAVCDEAGISLLAADATVQLGMRRLVREVAQRGYLSADGKLTERVDDYSYQLDASTFVALTEDECKRARRLAGLPGSYSVSLAGDPCAAQQSCCP